MIVLRHQALSDFRLVASPVQSYIRGLSEVFGNNYSYWVQMEACQIISESNIMVHGASIMILLTEIIIDLPPSEPNTCSYL